jgi:hypothetical protein
MTLLGEKTKQILSAIDHNVSDRALQDLQVYTAKREVQPLEPGKTG